MTEIDNEAVERLRAVFADMPFATSIQLARAAIAAMPGWRQDREQIAKVFAIIWHGDAEEWRGFLSKADSFLSFPWACHPAPPKPEGA